MQKQKILKFFPQNLLFHFLSKHRDRLLEFRLWIIARYFLDHKKCGACNIEELINFAKIKPGTLIKYARHSKLFIKYENGKIYYVSQYRVAKLHKLRMKTKFRAELLSNNYLKRFQNQTKFKAYIIKCYFENDPRKKKYRQYTNGRISIYNTAKHFNLSERTIQRLIKTSKAVTKINIKEYPKIKVNIKHKLQFGNWILNHAEDKIDGHNIIENPNSYFVRFVRRGEYRLCQRLPNIFRITGVRVVVGIIRG